MAKNTLNQPERQAIERFLASFVAAKKRVRAQKYLLGDSEQRVHAIQMLPDWLAPSVRTETIPANAAGQLAVRFGSVEGYLVEYSGVYRTLIDDAISVAKNGFGGLFVSDDNMVALLIPELGRPLLCLAHQ